jgi:hypothetical protein
VPTLDDLSTELFLDMIDELGGVMGTLHQQTKPTFEFIISKEVETV